MKIQCTTFVEIEQIFPLQQAMGNYNKTHVSPYDLTKLAIHSFLRSKDDIIPNCLQTLKKTVSFDEILQIIDEENIVFYANFVCGITFYLKLLQKSDRSTENVITFPDPVKNPSAFPAMINITALLMSSIAPKFFWNRTFYRTCFQQLLCHSTTLMIDTLCPISTPSQQLTNLEQTHIRSSLQCERGTVKERGCASLLHFFKKITYRTDEWTKQLLRLKSWVISGNPERWIVFRRLWWTVIVFKCSHLFHLFHFYCLLVQHLLCFRKFTLFVHFDDFEWEVKVHRQLQCKVTLP